MDTINPFSGLAPISFSESELHPLIPAAYDKVYKSNTFIQEVHTELSTNEQRLLLYAISKIKPEDDVSTIYNISISEFCKSFGFQENNIPYTYIKNIAKSLRDKSWWIQTGEKKSALFFWFSFANIDEGSGTIGVMFNPIIAPYLFHLRQNWETNRIPYTSYTMLNVAAFKRKASFNLYELLLSYTKTVECWTFDFDDFRNRLCGNKYPRVESFRRCVLDPSVEEINAYSDLQVRYEVMGRGSTKKIQLFFKEKEVTDRVATEEKVMLLLGARNQTFSEKD